MNLTLSILTAVVSGLVALSSFAFGRRKTAAEAERIDAEAERIDAETDNIKDKGWVAVNAELRLHLNEQAQRIDQLTERLNKYASENHQLRRRVRHLELLYDHPEHDRLGSDA